MRLPRPKLLALAALSVLLPGPPAPSRAATPERSKPPRSESVAAQEAAVRAVIDAFFAAAQRRDWSAAAALMSDEFELYTDDAAAFDKEDYHRLLQEDDIEVHHMELRDMKLRVSPDAAMAWAKYRGIFRGTSRGAAHDVETAETLIFTSENGRWKIVRAHASVKPAGGERAAR